MWTVVGSVPWGVSVIVKDGQHPSARHAWRSGCRVQRRRWEGDAMPSGSKQHPTTGKPEPTWRSTLRAASIFLLVTASVAFAFYGLR
jgi:hypothetical protein